MEWAIFERVSGDKIGDSFPTEDGAWAEAHRRGLGQQGRLEGKRLELLNPLYEIRCSVVA